MEICPPQTATERTASITIPTTLGNNQISLTFLSPSKFTVGDDGAEAQPTNVPVTAIIRRRQDDTYAWIVCLSACIVQALIIGVNHSFGVFYVEFIKEFQCGKGTAAWVGALPYGLTLWCGLFCSPLIEKYGHQIISVIGCIICCISLVATSFAQSIGMTFLTFSFLYGVGSSFAYTATMTLVDCYFSKYVTTATGVTMSGSSIGTLIMNPLAQVLVSAYGWRATFQMLAASSLLAMGCSWTFKTPPHRKTQLAVEGEERKPTIKEMFKNFDMCNNKRFLIWLTGLSFIMFGYYIPYVHLIPYAIEQGMIPKTASVLIMVLGASTTAGRLIFGRVAQNSHFNKLHISQTCTILLGAGSMLLPLLHSVPSLVAYIIVIGLLDGGYVVMLPVLTGIYSGKGSPVIGWGIMVGIISIPYTLGAPVAGWLFDATGNYMVPFLTAGIIVIIGVLILCGITVLERRMPTEEKSKVEEQEAKDTLPDLEVLTVMSNSAQDFNVSTTSFDSILVLGLRNSRLRHNVEDVEVELRRYESPVHLVNPIPIRRLAPGVRAPRRRTVSVGEQNNVNPKQKKFPLHSNAGLLMDIQESSSRLQNTVPSYYSANDLRTTYV